MNLHSQGVKKGQIGVGIAGYGLAGRVFHATLVAHTPGLELRAVFSRTAERRAQAQQEYAQIALHETYASLLADPKVQLVIVATPHDTHAAMVVAAAQAGRHVVVDKVMCLSVDEGEQMIRAATASGVVFSVFQNRRWDADYLTVRRVLEQGLVGEPYVIESAVTSFGPSRGYSQPTTDRPRGWRSYAEFGGGPLRDWGAHLFDQAVQLAGPTPDVLVADLQYRRDWDVETAGVVWMRYPASEREGTRGGREGVRYVIETGAISAIPKPRWLIRGSEGAYLQHGRDAQEAALQRGEVGPRVMDAAHTPRLVRFEAGGLRDVPVEQVPGNYLAYYENVVAALRGEAPLAVEPSNVLHSVRLITAALESGRASRGMSPSAPRRRDE